MGLTHHAASQNYGNLGNYGREPDISHILALSYRTSFTIRPTLVVFVTKSLRTMILRLLQVPHPMSRVSASRMLGISVQVQDDSGWETG